MYWKEAREARAQELELAATSYVDAERGDHYSQAPGDGGVDEIGEGVRRRFWNLPEDYSNGIGHDSKLVEGTMRAKGHYRPNAVEPVRFFVYEA
jgi:hypothetical protein